MQISAGSVTAPPRSGFWLSGPNTAAAEICTALGYDFVVLDIEHGIFDLATLEAFIPTLKGLGITVLSKVLSPNRGPIQQALDFGSDGVVIPHIENVDHARGVTRHAKFAPVGDRGFAGGRTTGYGPVDDEWVLAQNASTLCLPIVERARALADVSAIMELDTVDGVFLGPSDMSLSRGRGAYQRSAEDFEDIRTIASAAKNAVKPWMMCAWTPEELNFALDLGVDSVALKMEHTALRDGFSHALDQFTAAAGERLAR